MVIKSLPRQRPGNASRVFKNSGKKDDATATSTNEQIQLGLMARTQGSHELQVRAIDSTHLYGGYGGAPVAICAVAGATYIILLWWLNPSIRSMTFSASALSPAGTSASMCDLQIVSNLARRD